MIDGLIAAVEADRVIGGRDEEALDPVPAGGLDRVVEADDVGLEDVLPVVLAGLPAEMHHGIDALGDAQHVGELGDVRAHEGFARAQVADRLDVGEPELVFPGQLGPQEGADAPGGTRHQDCFHTEG